MSMGVAGTLGEIGSRAARCEITDSGGRDLLVKLRQICRFREGFSEAAATFCAAANERSGRC